jgi:hypothetical protein
MISISTQHCLAYLLVGSLLLGSRVSRAAISDNCLTSTLALAENQEVAAMSPSGSCEIQLGVSSSCTYDFHTTNSNYQNACINNGGNFYEEDVLGACKIPFDGQTYKVTYNFKNQPWCFGSSCTDAEAMEYYDTILFPGFEQTLGSQGATCDISGESASARIALSVTVVVVSAIAAVASLL